MKRTGWMMAGVSILILGCAKKEVEAPKLEAFPIKAELVSRRDLEDVLTVVGSLKAKNEATLFSRVPGKLLENLAKEGDPVQKGQAVALIERDEVGVEFKPAPVPSTLSGVVGRVYLDRGSNVDTDTPVAMVLDTGEVVAKADIPERYVGRVTTGQAVRVSVESYPGREFHGRVSQVSPAVDPVTRAMPIEVRLENKNGALKSGMFAQMSIVVARKAGVLSAPESAVTDGS
ncbi:MAG: efflux RND transporter periplasmic adaptor subunit, partial [Elusimicrobia bacterium]|nr:efflux RND transporter periplasmic adaptor subunit [Elusimicrobiota bacterium]